jgi:hypothetical protein
LLSGSVQNVQENQYIASLYPMTELKSSKSPKSSYVQPLTSSIDGEYVSLYAISWNFINVEGQGSKGCHWLVRITSIETSDGATVAGSGFRYANASSVVVVDYHKNKHWVHFSTVVECIEEIATSVCVRITCR